MPPTLNRRVIKIWDLNREMVQVLLGNTIETYPPEWRLIHEALQNSIDSFLDDDGKPIEMAGATPEVQLELFLGSNMAVVTDNGQGIPPQRFTHFLFLGNGTKGNSRAPEIRRKFKGSQGVGIKSTVFTSEFFKISTVQAGRRWEMELPGFSRYLDPTFAGSVEEPVAEPTDEHSGTTVAIRLSGYTVEDFVRERVAEFFEAVGIDPAVTDAEHRIVLEGGRAIGPFSLSYILMRYLRRQSYVGCVSRTLGTEGLPSIQFSLRVVCDFDPGVEDRYRLPGVAHLRAGKILTAQSPVEYLDFQELIRQLPAKQRPTVVSDYKHILEAGQTFSTPTVFCRVLNYEDVERLLGKIRKRRASDPAGATPNVLVDDPETIARNRTALTRVNGGILFIASRKFLNLVLAHKSSIAVSVNGLPTDIVLEVTGAELGYVPSTHLIVDVDETLGYGKRNLAPRSKGVYNLLVKDLWKSLYRLAGNIVPEEEEFDLTIKGKHFDKIAELKAALKTKQEDERRKAEILGRLTIPRTEEDVVATYFSMAERGLVPRYNFLRLNDVTVYDGLAFPPGTTRALKEEEILTVEFKFSTYGLCESDRERRQRFEDIQVLIVWEATDSEDLPPDYFCVPREGDVGYTKYLEGVNYRLKHGRHSVQVIALKDIFEESLRA